MICPRCEGIGQQPEEYPIIIKYPTGIVQKTRYSIACQKCHATGELNWVDGIIGKQGTIDADVLIKYSFEKLVE